MRWVKWVTWCMSGGGCENGVCWLWEDWVVAEWARRQPDGVCSSTKRLDLLTDHAAKTKALHFRPAQDRWSPERGWSWSGSEGWWRRQVAK